MGSLHHEDEIGPFDKLVRERIFSVAFGPYRDCGDALDFSEEMFSCRTTQAVLAAYEQIVAISQTER